MLAFMCCPGNSPFGLGMVEFDCCGTQELLSEVENDGDEVENDADGDFVSVKVKTPVKWKKLSLSNALWAA